MTFFGRLFNSRLFTVLFSLLCALTLWFYVALVYNPDTSLPFTGIPVTVEFKGSVPDILELVQKDNITSTIDLNINGPRYLLTNLDKEDIKVKADLTAVNQAGEYQIPITVELPDERLEVVSKNPQSITMSFDVKSSVQVSVKVVTNGNVSEGFILDKPQKIPEQIRVTGPETVIKTIAFALCAVDVSNISETKTGQTKFTLVDSANNEVSMVSITTDFDAVNVTVPVLKNKEVPLQVEIVNTSGGSDTTFATVKIVPEKILISGSESDLNLINSINIGKIDTAKIVKDFTGSFNIVLPNGVKNVDGIEKAQVTVTLSDVVTKTFDISNIVINNKPANKTVKLLTSSISVKVRGLATDLGALSADNIIAAVDLEGTSNDDGRFTFPVKFEFPQGINAGVSGEYTAVISIK